MGGTRVQAGEGPEVQRLPSACSVPPRGASMGRRPKLPRGNFPAQLPESAPCWGHSYSQDSRSRGDACCFSTPKTKSKRSEDLRDHPSLQSFWYLGSPKCQLNQRNSVLDPRALR